jgi:hypothetical protein
MSIRRVIKKRIFELSKEGMAKAKENKEQSVICAIKAEALNELLNEINKNR